MAFLDDSDVFPHVMAYYNGSAKEQGRIVNEALDELTPIILAANKSKRTSLGNLEARCEAVYPLLVEFRRCASVGSAQGFVEGFKIGLNQELLKYSARRGDQWAKLDVDKLDPADPGETPEQLCSNREQVAIVKDFLKRKCSDAYGDMVMRYYMEHQSLKEIGAAYGITGQAVGARIKPYLLLLKTYMKRINK